MNENSFPAWTESRLVPDEVFAAAYAALPGARRAWLKKTIAQVHTLAGPMRDPRETGLTEHRQGFVSRRESLPLADAVLFLDETCTSAAMAVAAAVPMLLSGVARPCAVRLGQGEPVADEVLAGLELAGLETVFHLDEAAARKFMEHFTSGPGAAALFQGQGPALTQLRTAAGYAAPPLRIWKPFTVDSVGVFAGAGTDWDFELLAWVHPCARIEVHGLRTAVPGLPPQCARARGGFEAMLGAGHAALYVPAARLDEAAGAARLVLGPGQEGCWAWPGLATDFFRSAHLALLDAGS